MSKRSWSQRNVDQSEQTSAPVTTAMTATTLSALPPASQYPGVFAQQFQPHSFRQEYFVHPQQLSQSRPRLPLPTYHPNRPLPPSNVGIQQGPATSPLPTQTPKSKQHVQSACVNCKQAHLSCDDHRPCERCVRRNIGDTCRDVPHRKRGRPRIREQIPNEAAPFPLDRPRRVATAASVSKAVEDKPGVSPISPESTIDFSSHTRPPLIEFSSKPPVAFLDMDFRIWTMNGPFKERFSFLGDLKGKPLDLLVDPSSQYSLDSLRQIRSSQLHERDEKNPSYMPPIRIKEDSWKYSIPTVEAQDLTSICQGYTTYHHQLQLLFNSSEARTVSVEFCLSKATVIFVVFKIPLIQSPQRPSLTFTASSLTSLSSSDLERRRQSTVSQGKYPEVSCLGASEVSSPSKSTTGIAPTSPISTVSRQSYKPTAAYPGSGTVTPQQPYVTFPSDPLSESLYTTRKSEPRPWPIEFTPSVIPTSTHLQDSSNTTASKRGSEGVMLPPIASLGHSTRRQTKERKEIAEDQERQESSRLEQAQQRSADRKRRANAIDNSDTEYDERSQQPAGQSDRPHAQRKRKRGLDVKDLTD